MTDKIQKPARPIVLANRYMVAQFSPTTGALTRLLASGTRTNLIDSISCKYFERLSDMWTDETADVKDAGRFTVVCVEQADTYVQSQLKSPHVTVTRRFELDDTKPLLRVSLMIQTLGVGGELSTVGFPVVRFASGFANIFEDDRDLYFDGAELGNAKELPCWRVFYRKRAMGGLLLITRSKQQMSHAEILSDGLHFCPHLRLNYSTLVPRPVMDVSIKRRYEIAFELGPWQQVRHRCLLRASGLQIPIATDDPPTSGRPARKRKGKIFRAVKFASATSTASQFSLNKWMIASIPWAQGGKALFAGPGVRPPALRFDPKLKGTYRIFIGIGNGAGVALRASGDPEVRYRVSPTLNYYDEIFEAKLSGHHKGAEVELGIMRMAGRTLTISRYPDQHLSCMIDYVRFEKLTETQCQKWLHRMDRDPVVELSGFVDTPDIASLTNARDPDPGVYSANIWEHANCGIKKIYWRVDGQCSDFPSKHNTMRYVSALTHGVFYPQAKAYGRILQKTDLLNLAMKAAQKYHIEMWGWMRFNSYGGNTQSNFFKSHPELWDHLASGQNAYKLCLAHKAVRQHKISILVEAAQYGLSGLCLGFLRHAPVINYAPVLIKRYRKRYGRLPPRAINRDDPMYRLSVPPDGRDWKQWFTYRAHYLTLFGRELRHALQQAQLGHVKISIWVRPTHCLFDGIDMEAWLDEHLCDEVIASPIGLIDQAFQDSMADCMSHWRDTVQAKVPLIGGINGLDYAWSKREVKRLIDCGYDGICTYESNISVMESQFIKLYEGLRR